MANREFNQGSTCAFDSNQNAGLLVNDTIAIGRHDRHRRLGSLDPYAGHGVVIQELDRTATSRSRGDKVYNNCGSGVYVQDTTTHVFIAASESISHNGNTGMGAACVNWQSSGNPGYGSGYGIQAASATSNIVSFASPFGNTAGGVTPAPSNVLTGLLTPTFTASSSLDTMTLTAPASTNAKLTLNTTSASQATYFALGAAGTNLWQIGNDTNAHFRLWDLAVGGSTFMIDCTTGGNCIIGESSTNLLNINGSLSTSGAYKLGGRIMASTTAPTFTSGACVGAMGTANSTAAFTVSTGTGSCGSTFTLGMPGDATGWVCDANDEAIAGTTAIRETADTTTSVTFTNYSVGSSPAAVSFPTSHTIKVKCTGY